MVGVIPRDLDELDKKIIQHVTEGTYSHSKLAELTGASKSTIYRRLKELEEEGVLEKRIMAIPNFEEIGFSSIILGIKVGIGNLNKIINFLEQVDQVKFLWRTYGEYEAVAVLMCDEQNVGVCINNLKEAIENMDIEVENFVVAPSVSCEKMELAPFESE